MLSISLITLVGLVAVVLVLGAIHALKGEAAARQALGVMTALAAVGIIACVVLMFVVAERIDREPEPLPFTVEGWFGPYSDANGFTYTRYRMVRDLLRQYEFRGWSLAQVAALLGPPDKEAAQAGGLWVYYDLGNGLDFLIFEADARHVVVTTRIHRH